LEESDMWHRKNIINCWILLVSIYDYFILFP
jgi:hypothetical protein